MYELFPGESFHALRHIRNTKYVADCPRRSYSIRQDKMGQYYIHIDWGGNIHKDLKGKFLTFRDAERTLIGYLRRPENNKFGRAIYPGCREV